MLRLPPNRRIPRSLSKLVELKYGLAVGLDAVQHCRSLLRNRGRHAYIAEFWRIALAVLQRPLKQFANGFGCLRVLILFAQQDPGECNDWVGVSALGIRNKDAEILGHISGIQCRTTTLVRCLYKFALFVLESGGIQSYFPGELVTDIANRSIRLSN